MHYRIQLIACFVISLTLWIACGSDSSQKQQTESDQSQSTRVTVPSFDRDSALHFLKKQLEFGPRVPGTEAHSQCADYLSSTLERFGAEVQIQTFNGSFYTGEKFTGKNIIGVINPNYSKRILLCAHWDSRFEATEEEDPELREKPIPGADDGGSGVAVLLEIARQISANDLNLGVDIIFFDGEDQGENKGRNMQSWCLGSQHWTQNFHTPNYQAQYGILLDMVGSKNARFAKEGYSMQHASDVMNKVWSLAQRMSYGNYFVDKREQGVLDDHYFINTNTNIPTINIINRTGTTESGFGPYWHTHKDNLDNISKHTLKAVGQVVLATLYHEAGGTL